MREFHPVLSVTTSSIPQKIIGVVIPVRISNKIRVPRDAPSLEEALSIPLLEGN